MKQRRTSISILLAFCCVGALGVGAMGVVYAQPAVDVESDEPVKKVKKKRQIRRGSYLHFKKGLSEPQDRRSDFERWRDLEMQKHVRRLAQLDRIEKLALSKKKDDLLTQVERVRRAEQRRHRDAMMEIQRGALFLEAVGHQ